MLIDASNQFSANQSLTALGSTASTNIIDLGVARDIGDAVTNRDLFLLCQVSTTFASGGSATLQVQLQSAPDNGSGQPDTWATIEQSDAIPLASLVQGYKFLAGAMASPPTPGRFLRLNYVIGTAVMTAGAITAGLVPAVDQQPAYARAYAA
jgi:hypothetical protein